MSTCFAFYPTALLNQLQKGQGLKQQLSDEILRVVRGDPELQQQFQQLQQQIRDQTMPTFNALPKNPAVDS